MIALLRQAGYDAPIYLHGAMLRLCALYEARGIALGELRHSLDVPKYQLKGQIVIAPPSAIKDRWSRRLPDPVLAVASGWMSVKQRANQSGVELPLVISDHVDWTELRETIIETGAETVLVTHGREEALVYWCRQQGLDAEPLRITAYEEDGDGEDAA
jgi:putative mRNA 3-end processing factor